MATDFESRLAALEDKVANLKVGDLPLRDLQRKLEFDWQPNGSVLLEPRSVTADQLADGVVPDLRYGVLTGTTGAAQVTGTGDWSSARSSTGVYVVTWNPAFTTVPVAVMSRWNTAGAGVTIRRDSTSTAASLVLVATNAAGTLVDVDVAFIAIAPR